MDLKQSVNVKHTAGKGVGWLSSKRANPSPTAAANRDDSEEVSTAQGEEALPSAHPGRWKEAAEPGPGYLLVFWGSGTFHSHLKTSPNAR